MFTSDADLSGVATGKRLEVSDAIQKVFIQVTEKGTEAGVATGELFFFYSNTIPC